MRDERERERKIKTSQNGKFILICSEMPKKITVNEAEWRVCTVSSLSQHRTSCLLHYNVFSVLSTNVKGMRLLEESAH